MSILSAPTSASRPPTRNRGWKAADHLLTAAMISGLLIVVIAVAVNL